MVDNPAAIERALMNHASKHLRWLYAIVLVGGVVAILDTYLPTKRATSVIERVSEFSSFESHRGGRGRTRYWSSIDLRNGKNIWTQRTANNFAVGDTIEIDISAVVGKVVRYNSHASAFGTWVGTEEIKEEYRPFPFVAVLIALLLFYPKWSTESRMLLHGVLFVTLVAWMIIMAAT